LARFALGWLSKNPITKRQTNKNKASKQKNKKTNKQTNKQTNK
jgi:hypothetical protein